LNVRPEVLSLGLRAVTNHFVVPCRHLTEWSQAPSRHH